MGKHRLRVPLHARILVGMGLGALSGLLLGRDAEFLGVRLLDVYSFLGDLFLKSLSMLVVPLIATSIVSGVMGTSERSELGRLGIRTLAYYALTSLLAIATGLLFVDVLRPGIVGGIPAGGLLGLDAAHSDVIANIGKRANIGLGELILRLIPENPLSAAVEGEILPLVVFCLLFGMFAVSLRERLRSTVGELFEGSFQVMLRLTGLVMLLAPFGVFGLMARTTAVTGVKAFGPLGVYFVTVLSGLLVHFLLTLPGLVWVVRRRNPYFLHSAMAPALLTAFSTASSSATLPVTLEAAEKRAGISKSATRFVLPLGATVNMDGTALYECVAAMFIAQAYGVDLSIEAQFMVVLTALLASVGAAGIPAAGLVMLAVVLKAVGLPLEAVGMILAVDRLLDMCRTAVNVFSDTCCAYLVSGGSREKR